MFKLLDKEIIGKTIRFGNKVRVSDPGYDIDTWCAGTLDNVLPGEYTCFTQRADTGDWGIRIASIEVRHKDYQDVDATEIQDIDVGVDSGQCGIYDLDYFIEARKDKNGEDAWYWRVCANTEKYTTNPKYVPFEESSFYKNDFKLIHYAFEHEDGLSLDSFSSIERREYVDARGAYNKSICSFEKSYVFAASTLDNKCLVSSSGYGDGSYTCLVGRNIDGKIVSIKIDYYHGYDEDDDE